MPRKRTVMPSATLAPFPSRANTRNAPPEKTGGRVSGRLLDLQFAPVEGDVREGRGRDAAELAQDLLLDALAGVDELGLAAALPRQAAHEELAAAGADAEREEADGVAVLPSQRREPALRSRPRRRSGRWRRGADPCRLRAGGQSAPRISVPPRSAFIARTNRHRLVERLLGVDLECRGTTPRVVAEAYTPGSGRRRSVPGGRVRRRGVPGR